MMEMGPHACAYVAIAMGVLVVLSVFMIYHNEAEGRKGNYWIYCAAGVGLVQVIVAAVFLMMARKHLAGAPPAFSEPSMEGGGM